jgi:hypothetical protein
VDDWRAWVLAVSSVAAGAMAATIATTNAGASLRARNRSAALVGIAADEFPMFSHGQTSDAL